MIGITKGNSKIKGLLCLNIVQINSPDCDILQDMLYWYMKPIKETGDNEILERREEDLTW